ncbi:DNA polymerase [Bienertia sinuspersici]
MDVYEFEESEVMFSLDYSSSDQSVESEDDHERVDEVEHKPNKGLDGCKMMLKRRKSLKKMRKVSSSLPIHIPNNSLRYDSDDVESSGSLDEDQMMRLPPHLIVERRRFHKELARSFPLKERNLYYVRNCIIRMNDGLS